MVSPLSSRILNAEAKVNFRGMSKFPYKPLTADVIQSWQRNKKRVSGYSADRDADNFALRSPTDVSKQIRAHNVETHAKRRKIEDLNFQAFNVRNDLAKAGVECVPGLIGRSRALPHGSVSMDNAKLVVVSRDTPSTAEEGGHCQTEVEPATKYPTSVDGYAQLLNSCQHFYTTTGRIPSEEELGNGPNARSSASSNTTESTTPIDSESESDPTEISLPPQAVDIVGQGFFNDSSNDDSITFIHDSMKSTDLLMEDALVSSESARLIIEGSLSHRILHANAAFTKLTGISSEEVLDRPIADIVHNSFCSKTIVSITSGDKKSAKDLPKLYALETSPIKNTYEVTHFALDFADPSLSLASNIQAAAPVHMVG